MPSRFGNRPPRLALVFAPTPLYFVTFCTYRHMPWLACDSVHAAFVRFSNRAGRDHNIAVGRYVIMQDHAHLFVCGDQEFILGQWIGHLKQALGKAAKRSRLKARIWQEGCFDHLLRNDESYSQKWNYVRENPVRAGLAKNWEDWPYQGEIVYIDRV